MLFNAHIQSRILPPARWCANRQLRFTIDGQATVLSGKVLDRSLNDFVLVLSSTTLQPGDRITPVDDAMARRHGFRSAIVRGREALHDGRIRLFVDILA